MSAVPDKKQKESVRQAGKADVGLLALAIVGRHFQTDVDVGGLAHELCLASRRADPIDLVRAAQHIGLRARSFVNQRREQLNTVPRPAILRMKNGDYYVLDRASNGSDTLRDPLDIRARVFVLDSIVNQWSGEIVLVTKRGEIAEKENRFGFQWFFSSARRYRKPLIHVLVTSLFVQLFALVTPLLFQVVVDKVLVHKTISTLEVVVCCLVVMNVFDICLQYLRSYALYHTASRIDVELGSQIFRQLFRLHLSYFESRPTGQTVARVREVETVRAFLTGQGLTSIVDMLFAVVFVAFLFTYSITLTIAVLCMVPLFILVVSAVRPLLREKIKQRFNRGAISQQFLVESIVGAPTLKAASVEPLVQQQWEERLAAYVQTSFQTVMLGNLGQLGIQFLNKTTTAVILFFGAEAVIAGNMTVGQLIAFNMISNQLMAPILRLSQLWQDIQQVQISVDRLGDIFNEPGEEYSNSMEHLPQNQIKGALKLEGVTFRYRSGAPIVLDNVSLDIPPGQVIGVVGPSGSGKSTLTKIMQRMYIPEQGKVIIDGVDIAQVHPAWFRRQIGVVLQENLLFNRTIHENITLANPAMPRDRVISIAKLAGADEFIRDLPKGYDTQIQERGANLSGGQRQRIAIARALARNPRILIFDEATSALDYESEKRIQENMREIVKGRTVIIVAHRLAAVRDCDRIISMSNGKIVEDGTHEELVTREGGIYARLWSLQRS